MKYYCIITKEAPLELGGFAQCVNKESSSERRNYVRAEQTDLLYANGKDLTQNGKV